MAATLLTRYIELHETYPEYLWYPGVLANASHSSENLAYQLRDHMAAHSSESSDDLKTYVNERLLQQGLGVYDATDDEVNSILHHPDPWPASYIFADIISRRAQVGWSTHGHSGKPPTHRNPQQHVLHQFPNVSPAAVDVNIYTSCPTKAKALVGNHENTDIGNFIRTYLDLDLKTITEELKRKGPAFDTVAEDGERSSWMGKPLGEERRSDGFDHYHGDFKRDLEHRGCGACRL